MTLFRAAQEGLTNVQRHAQATQAVLRVHLGEETATLTLRDNGRGLREAGESASDAGGYGLQGIRERVELVSGEMTVDSLPQGGAALTLSVPKNPARLTGGRRPERPSPWPGRSRRSQGARS
jgi:signal transduction histidine kinase